MSQRYLRGSWCLGLASLLALGCGSTEEPAGVAKGCVVNSDCSEGLTCTFGRCHSVCTNSRDCPEKARCTKVAEVAVCQLPDEVQCSYTSACAPPLVCGIDRQCRAQCSGDRDCVAGQKCVSSVCAEPVDLNDAGALPDLLGPADGGRTSEGGSGGSAHPDGSVLPTDDGGSLADVSTDGTDLPDASDDTLTVPPGDANDATTPDASISCTGQDNGFACGTDMVCYAGTCVACKAGGDCKTTPSSCKVGKVSCATGQPSCQGTADNSPENSACGASHYCAAGVCTYCSNGAACVPTTDCRKGTITCGTGGATCTASGTLADDDSACQTTKICASGNCIDADRTLTLTQGDAQSAPVDQLLPKPLQFKLVDGSNVVIPNKKVTLSPAPGAGSAPRIATTNVQGVTSFATRVGLTAGTYELIASTPGAAPIKVTATATAATARTIFTIVNTDHSAANDGVPGAGTLAHISGPEGIAAAKDGTIYFSDYSAHRIFQLSAQGELTVLAGTGNGGYSGDGGLANAAQLYYPYGLALDEVGRLLYIADYYNNVIRVIDLTNGGISTFAGGGTAPAPGYGDSGPASAATLSNPTTVALGPDGGLYIGDAGHNRIRRIDGITGVITAWLTPTTTCTASVEFYGCSTYYNGCSVAWDSLGNAFVSGQICGTSPAGATVGIVRKSGTGALVHIAGHSASGSSTAEGVPALVAGFGHSPRMAFDQGGNLFVNSLDEHKIRRIDGATGKITTIAGTGTSAYGGDYEPFSAAEFASPQDIALVGDSLAVADYNNHSVRLLTGVGSATASTATLAVAAGNAQSLYVDQLASPPLSVKLTDSAGAAVGQVSVQWSVVNSGGALYVTSSVTSQGGIASVSARPGLAAGAYTFQARYFDIHGQPVISSPTTFTLTAGAPPAGSIFTVLNSDHSAADDGLPGPGTLAHVNHPRGVTTATDGTIYVADETTHRVLKVALDGTASVVAGNGTQGFSGDGGPAPSAQLYGPRALALNESSHTLYIADNGNARVRAVDLTTGSIDTIGGGGSAPAPGYGDSGPATSAVLASVTSLAIGPDAALYVADSGHSRFRRIDTTSGVITAWVNSATTCTDALSIYDCYYDGCKVAFDASGNAYLAGRICSASSGSYAHGVVKRTSSGTLTHVAGHVSTGGSTADGVLATTALLSVNYYAPEMAIDPSGNLLLSQSETNNIRRVSAADGKITTIIGDGTASYLGDYTPAISAQLKTPQGIAWTAAGHLILADYGNSCVREVW